MKRGESLKTDFKEVLPYVVKCTSFLRRPLKDTGTSILLINTFRVKLVF